MTGTTLPSMGATATRSLESNVTSLWSFDNNTCDSLSSFDGVLQNNATYRTPEIKGYNSAFFVVRDRE